MAKNKKQQKRRQSVRRRGAEDPILGAPVETIEVERQRVAALIAEAKQKDALARAKLVHAELNSKESEALLADAYAARAEQMSRGGLALEAKALLDVAMRNLRDARGRLRDTADLVAARSGSLDALLAPLAREDLASDERERIERFVQDEITDLAALAQCKALSADHPLRQGAEALRRAFEAVTSGPTRAEDLDGLRHVARRSPLAPWKMLIRAIDRFYQDDEAACRRALDAVAPGSAPACLVPVLRAMLAGESDASLGSEANALLARIEGSSESLRKALRDLDQLLENSRHNLRAILATIERTVAICKSVYPDLCEQLRQHISIRCVLDRHIPVEPLQMALGGPTHKNAYFWRLFAHAMVATGDIPQACIYWEEFRRNAIYEGWFGEMSPEAACIYSHMAELLERVDSSQTKEAIEFFERRKDDLEFFYTGAQHAERRAALFGKGGMRPNIFQVETLRELACRADPSAEHFRKRLDALLSRKHKQKELDSTARAWAEALPRDPEPFLMLSDVAEKRNALKKALGYLEEAEGRDALNPEVRRARVRLLANIAKREIYDIRPHLLIKTIGALESLPLLAQGDAPAFVEALKWVYAGIMGDSAEAERRRAEVERLLEGALPAIFLLTSILPRGFEYRDCRAPIPPKGFKKDTQALAAAVVRGQTLANAIGVSLPFPEDWKGALLQALRQRDCPLDTQALRLLTEAALRQRLNDMAFIASGVGLRRGGAAQARFLYLRGRSLPYGSHTRRSNCMRVALELARTNRDMDLVRDALSSLQDINRYAYYSSYFSERDLAQPIVRDRIEAVIDRERRERKAPRRSDFYAYEEDLLHKSVFDSLVDLLNGDAESEQSEGGAKTLHDDFEEAYEEDESEEYDDSDLPNFFDDDEEDEDDSRGFGFVDDEDDYDAFLEAVNQLPYDQAEVILESMAAVGGFDEDALPSPFELFENNPKKQKLLYKAIKALHRKGVIDPNSSSPAPPRPSPKAKPKKKKKRGW